MNSEPGMNSESGDSRFGFGPGRRFISVRFISDRFMPTGSGAFEVDTPTLVQQPIPGRTPPDHPGIGAGSVSSL